jgi:hypothetical protein
MQFIEQEDVNILNFLPQKNTPFPCFRHMLWSIFFIATLFLLFAVGPALTIHSVREQIVSLISANKTYSSKVDLAKQSFDRDKGHYITTLKRPLLYQEQKFSIPLVSLAEKKLKSLWLYDVLINNETKQIKLKGKSYKASGLYSFLDFLNGQKAFMGNSFSVVKIVNADSVKVSGTGSKLSLKSALNRVNKKQFSQKQNTTAQAEMSGIYYFEVDNLWRSVSSPAGLQKTIGAKLIVPKSLVRQRLKV